MRHCKPCGRILAECACDEDDGEAPGLDGTVERIDIPQTTDETWRKMLGG